MKSQNTKNSDELKREVDHQLNKVKNDIDSLQGRLTPGQFIDDAIFQRQGRNLSATFDHLKRNPVGTTLLSLGTILLMEDENHHSMEWYARTKASSLKNRFSSAKDTIQSQHPHNEITGGESVSSEESNFSFSEPGKERLKDRASDLYSNSKERIGTIYGASRDKIQNLDPLTYMALGAGLGALTGAALPISEKERDFIKNKIEGHISEFGNELQNALNECSNILKDLVVQDVKDYSFKPFR
jgi:hypothetical protein